MTYENDDIEALFKQLDSNKTEEELIEEDSYRLQASFLSEIERLSRQHGFNRKELAVKIKTSPSYLTQVFRGDKPLNFITLAKIKRALGIRFDVKAYLYSESEINKELNLFSIKTDTIPSEQRDADFAAKVVPMSSNTLPMPLNDNHSQYILSREA